MCLARSRSSSAASPALACLTKDAPGKLGCTRRISAARRRASVGEKKLLRSSAAMTGRLPGETTGENYRGKPTGGDYRTRIPRETTRGDFRRSLPEEISAGDYGRRSV